jgi:hypothetical protein
LGLSVFLLTGGSLGESIDDLDQGNSRIGHNEKTSHADLDII